MYEVWASSMKWPKDESKPASFRELAKCVRKAFLDGANWERINRSKNIKWTGPPQGKYSAPVSLAFGVGLRAKTLRVDETEQGRDFLDHIIGIALQLGVEQGRRIHNEKNKSWVNMMKRLIENIEAW